MWSIHMMKYSSALQRKETLTQAATGINLEDIMLNEVSQSQKDKRSMISTYMRSRVVKFIETENVVVVSRVVGTG